MLNKTEVDAEEERLHKLASELPDEQRKQFYRAVQAELRDPDTYAVLNWFFLAGLHHFYLRNWGRGVFDLAVFLVGVALLFTPLMILGVAVIIAVSAWELWALFRAQIIVQDWNNQLYQRHLDRITAMKDDGGQPLEAGEVDV